MLLKMHQVSSSGAIVLIRHVGMTELHEGLGPTVNAQDTHTKAYRMHIRTQIIVTETFAILTSNETVIIPKTVSLKPRIPYDVDKGPNLVKLETYKRKNISSACENLRKI